MKQLSAQDVLNAFDPIDRDGVAVPDLAGIDWDGLDYLAWKDPMGHRAYVCIVMQARTVGLVFRLHGSAHRRGGVCDLCLGSDRVSGTTAVMVDGWLEPRAAFGLHVCSDFDCSRGARGQKYIDRMGETIPNGQATERLQRNLERFVQRVTGIG